MEIQDRDVPTYNSVMTICIGVMYLSYPAIQFLLYVIVMYLLLTDKEQWKYQYHKIVISIGIADMAQLIFCGVASGVFTLWPYDIPYWINKLCGSVMNSCWFVYSISCHVLALNRFVHVVFSNNAESIFSKRLTTIYVTCIWVYGLVWFLVYYVFDVHVIYSKDLFAWTYDDQSTALVTLINFCIDLFNLVGMISMYACILVYLKMKVTFLE